MLTRKTKNSKTKKKKAELRRIKNRSKKIFSELGKTYVDHE